MKRKLVLSFMIGCITMFGLGMIDVSAYIYENFYWTSLNSNEVAITGIVNQVENLVIPAEIWGKPVVEIGGFGEAGKYGSAGSCVLERVTIPDGVRTIKDSAFAGCCRLQKVNLPDSIIYIGKEAFSECALSEIKIPTGVKKIPNGAFYDCRIENIIIPDNVTSIGNFAFYGNWPESITIGDGVTNIGNQAFDNPIGEDDLIYIYASSFRLKSLTLGSSIKSIGIWTSSDYYYFDNIYVKDIESYMNYYSVFAGKGRKQFIDTSKKIFDIPYGIDEIPDYFLYNWSGLESVIIPDSVTSIGDSAFRSSSITNITIPDSVTSIGDSAFRSSHITSVTIPDNVIIMGEDVFMECCNLYDAQIFGRIDTIGEKVFADCYSLKSVTIPDTVTTIIAGAFEDCDSLETVYYEASGDLTRHNNESLWRAKWIRCYFVKLINEEGELSYIYCLPNEKINISDIKKQYMKEVTLYTDKECSEEFNSQMPITDSMTLYIKLGEEITVIYGDINDDEKITMDDAIHLFNSTMFPEQYSISVGQKTDYNGDGNFDMNDAIYLFNYTMFPEQYPI